MSQPSRYSLKNSKMYRLRTINNAIFAFLTLSANIYSITMIQSYPKLQTHTLYSVPPPVTVTTTLANINNHQEKSAILNSGDPQSSRSSPLSHNQQHEYNSTTTNATTTISTPPPTPTTIASSSLLDQTLSSIARDLMSKLQDRSTNKNSANDLRGDKSVTDDSTEIDMVVGDGDRSFDIATNNYKQHSVSINTDNKLHRDDMQIDVDNSTHGGMGNKSIYNVEQQRQQATSNSKQYRQLDQHGLEIGYASQHFNSVNLLVPTPTTIDTSSVGPSISTSMAIVSTTPTSAPSTSTQASNQNSQHLQNNKHLPSRTLSLAPYANDHYHRSEPTRMPPFNSLGQTFDLPSVSKTNAQLNNGEHLSMLNSISQISATLAGEAAQHRQVNSQSMNNFNHLNNKDGPSGSRNDHQMQYSPVGNYHNDTEVVNSSNNIASLASSGRHPQMDVDEVGSTIPMKSNVANDHNQHQSDSHSKNQQHPIRGVNDRYVSLNQQYADVSELASLINNLNSNINSTSIGKDATNRTVSSVSSFNKPLNESSASATPHNQFYSSQHSSSTKPKTTNNQQGTTNRTSSSINSHASPPAIMVVRDGTDKIGSSDSSLVSDQDRSIMRGIGSQSVDSSGGGIGVSSEIFDEFQNHNTILNQIHSDMTPPGHYAASFVNLTAPMIPPLSAIEAVENSIQAESMYHTAHKNGQAHGLSSLLHSTSEQVDSAPINFDGTVPTQQQQQQGTNSPKTTSISGMNASAVLDDNQRLRLYGSTSSLSGRRPAYPPPNVPQGNQASGFRSPNNSSSPKNLSAAALMPPSTLSPYLGSISPGSMASLLASSPSHLLYHHLPPITSNTNHQQYHLSQPSISTQTTATTTGISSGNKPSPIGTIPDGQLTGGVTLVNGGGSAGSNSSWSKRLFNITRVEHISAECSNDLIRTVIIFNGTFKGIIYSSGYVQDPNCLYVNGTGKTRYEFNIKLNQCGTLGKQEEHRPTAPGGARRRDQVMWNTLSIQYNSIIEQEWDEHFRVSCEYGSDFWKTISFSPFNVETNTGSPVVFTINPPQCQMEILRGHGMVGPRQEAVSGPVTVGDPLTLLIHMRSEKAGYDILVKNCVAHDGNLQRMQLIDQNGCVVNERFISPFRGSYNDNDLRHVTLYSYLKAFRFTGTPVLYLECEIHMCQSACPPQMCYWRRLSKRSTNDTISGNSTNILENNVVHLEEYDSDGDDHISNHGTVSRSKEDMINGQESIVRNKEASRGRRASRQLQQDDNIRVFSMSTSTVSPPNDDGLDKQPVVSDKVSLSQSLEVKEKNLEETNLPSSDRQKHKSSYGVSRLDELDPPIDHSSVVCYRHGEIVAYMITIVALLVVASGVAIGCCWRASKMKYYYNKKMNGFGAGIRKVTPNKERHFTFISPLDYLLSTSSENQTSTLFNNPYNNHISPMSPAPSSPSSSAYCESMSNVAGNYSSHQSTAIPVPPSQPPPTVSKNRYF